MKIIWLVEIAVWCNNDCSFILNSANIILMSVQTFLMGNCWQAKDIF